MIGKGHHYSAVEAHRIMINHFSHCIAWSCLKHFIFEAHQFIVICGNTLVKLQHRSVVTNKINIFPVEARNSLNTKSKARAQLELNWLLHLNPTHHRNTVNIIPKGKY